ncbi:hypothetical protein DCCM_4390 [Desulfocucumis palustris]|uniref:Uncharacterized protein n=1 Tax=Desulfocucumis palustris TaxID=1898651 RepID=A0A2L2XG04_9FIRM|nr:hypothetical protein DCCM_4390 [Desulfocucumis palustris]
MAAEPFQAGFLSAEPFSLKVSLNLMQVNIALIIRATENEIINAMVKVIRATIMDSVNIVIPSFFYFFIEKFFGAAVKKGLFVHLRNVL